MMTVDRPARTILQNALTDYMKGAIHAFAFEERYAACRNSPDKSVQMILELVWLLHDDVIDHSICVSAQGWELLRRVVAFLGTEWEITTLPSETLWPWPFRDEGEWRANEPLVQAFELPEYDPAVHGRPVYPWWNRIPSSIGFLILIAVVAAVFLVIALL
ncbi:MAG TPA: hypothetical protein PLQ00_17750 [Thermoguttaceae bacterium]|nr:hypothetical protein [Thermoguttaceae bacterium]